MIQRLQTFAWDGGYLLEGLFDAVKWPFERAAWAIERGLLWPLQERSGEWNAPVRIFGVAAIAPGCDSGRSARAEAGLGRRR